MPERECCFSLILCFTGQLYVSDKCGSDQDGDGTEEKPFKTPLKVNARVLKYLCCFISLCPDMLLKMHHATGCIVNSRNSIWDIIDIAALVNADALICRYVICSLYVHRL